MASSTPPAHCTLTTPKTYQNHHLQHHHRRPRNQTPAYQHPSRRPPHFSLNNHSSHAAAAAAAGPRPPPPAFGSFPLLGAEFSGRRSTKTVSKFHADRPRSKVNIRHSAAAEEVLQLAVSYGGEVSYIDSLLVSFQPKLQASDDYVYLLRELGDRGDLMNAFRCFEFALSFERRRTDRGKLATSMISTLGRFGKTDLAKKVFENAVNEGYGNTIFAYSALIGAYAKSGRLDEAIGVFRRMKDLGLKPNTITYNSLIDACGKGGADYTRASEIFNDMLENEVSPDRVTYNSLLAVCSGAGLWEEARNLFDEMVHRGLEQDIYTYNTLLDAACSGGYVDAAFCIMAEMRSKNVVPNEVTYSTIIRSCAKGGNLDRALSLFNEMKSAGIKLDRVSYNTLLVSYADHGKFDEAFAVGKEMESMGIKKDVVTYNALLDRFGKQGMYDKVKILFAEMKLENLYPNLLTYSTLISVYCKGGLYKEASEAYRGLKQQGLKGDVVVYSNLIHASCKKGLVESSGLLLDEMMRDGIQPNVITYNSMIEAFNQSESSDCVEPLMESSNLEICGNGKMAVKEDDQIIEVFRELVSGKSRNGKFDQRERKDSRSVLGVFREMHEMKIKPNVVTFSEILKACSQCNSFEEASLLLEELRPFDNQVYGVAYGLLMGHNEYTWSQALSLFDDLKRIGSSTASGFYNALTDMLWHFGQKRGAQRVVLEAKRREVWENSWTVSCLDLHLMSSGAAQAMVHAWLLNIRSIVFEGHELPKLLCILTGWGKHSKVVGAGTVKRAIKGLLERIGAPFEVEKCNIGRYTSTGPVVAAWLRESGTLEVLVLRDDRDPAPGSSTRFDLAPSNLQPVLL